MFVFSSPFICFYCLKCMNIKKRGLLYPNFSIPLISKFFYSSYIQFFLFLLYPIFLFLFNSNILSSLRLISLSLPNESGADRWLRVGCIGVQKGCPARAVRLPRGRGSIHDIGKEEVQSVSRCPAEREVERERKRETKRKEYREI